MAKFKLPVSEYYSKSSTLHSHLKSVLDDFETDFLNKIKNAELDGKDLAHVHSLSSYTSAKNKHQSLKEEELLKLEHMSSEGGSNPVNPLIEKDKDFKGKFSDIQNGKNKEALSKHMGTVNTAINLKKNQQGLKDIIKEIKGIVDTDTYKRLMQLATMNPEQAITTLLKSEDVIKALEADGKLSAKLFDIMGGIDNLGHTVNKYLSTDKFKQCINRLLDSKHFNKFFDKLPDKRQEKLLNKLLTLRDSSGNTLINKGTKFIKNLTSLVKLDKKAWVKTGLTKIKDLGKTKIGKFAKICDGPAGVAIDKGITFTSSFVKGVSGKDGSVGKGVVEGAIDTVASIGPVDGVIVGAATFGPVGAIVGGVIGVGIQGTQLLFPNLVDNIKNNKITKSVEQEINDCGKAVKKGIDKAGGWISEKGNQLKRAAEKLINPPKLAIPNWF